VGKVMLLLPPLREELETAEQGEEKATENQTKRGGGGCP
jgi:hypothetical protein